MRVPSRPACQEGACVHTQRKSHRKSVAVRIRMGLRGTGSPRPATLACIHNTKACILRSCSVQWHAQGLWLRIAPAGSWPAAAATNRSDAWIRGAAIPEAQTRVATASRKARERSTLLLVMAQGGQGTRDPIPPASHLTELTQFPERCMYLSGGEGVKTVHFLQRCRSYSVQGRLI